MSFIRGASLMFDSLSLRAHRAFPPTRMEVKLHRPGQWLGYPSSPDYGYLAISANRNPDGTYELTEQRQGRGVIMTRPYWHALGGAQSLANGLSLDDAVRGVHRQQEARLREIDEAGRRIWSLVPNGLTTTEQAQRYGVAMNPHLRKSVHEMKDVLG